MQTILRNFTTKHLFDASADMLSHLKIMFTPQTKTPIPFEVLYTSATNSPLTMSLSAVLKKVRESFFIGTIDEDSLAGRNSDFDLQHDVEAKYQTMLVFAVEINAGESLSRTELATITRGFNRMASSLPVIVFIKNDNFLSLATCERSQYRQNWRDGEKLGKVAILRNINCNKVHRGHIDILESLGDKAYPTFDDLYDHWLDVFSSELLTRKFYTELAEWYAWVIGSGKVKFPNDINTTDDDAKFNHESVIRLITRLIFVWFLKQKKLIPNEFFDEKFIREHFIANFNPHSKNSLSYNPEQSKYYRLILQNLFFAMLNRPIMDEESGNDENRRFVTENRYQGKSQDYNINNLLRYKSEFAPGGADLLLKIANSTVPFLNGGLFECLDDKDNGKYYDGFSERKASLEQLSFPDYFFFGDEVGSDVDLSAWYDDKKKVHTKVRGLIDILRRYNFTVEENTPLEQDVSLDPELLGKVFENLLASYNPETKASARKQTGSFYTPREIVQYMVDESLIEHLCRICGVENKERYRSLLSYSTDNTDFTDKETDAIIEALHSCKVLDPACGSGAFPMGILQQMVHALRKLDPTNEKWKEFILKISLDKDKKAYQVKDEAERKRLRADIEQAFNRSINDPDYARKLYLIENCIYGVDIQPIAVQISKLRFFISLVAEQKPSDITKENFGIRPLPNLEAKFVAANSLIPLGEGNLFTDSEDIRKIKEKLADANHKLFIAKRNKDKRILRDLITSIRHDYANALVAIGAIDDDNAMKLAKWNMFDQNDFARFFDSQWMFGLSGGFDIVIGNPPYISVRTTLFDTKLKPTYKRLYSLAVGQYDLYTLFIERGYNLLSKGVLTYIIPTRMLSNENFMQARRFVSNRLNIKTYVNAEMCFENVNVEANIMVCLKDTPLDEVCSYNFDNKTKQFVFNSEIPYYVISKMPMHIFPFVFDIDRIHTFEKIINIKSKMLSEYLEITRGFECGKNDDRIGYGDYPFMTSDNIKPFLLNVTEQLYCSPDFNNTTKYKTKDVFKAPKLVTKFCSSSIQFALDRTGYYNTNSVYNCQLKDCTKANFLLAVLNSKLTTFWFNTAYLNIDNLFPHIQKNQLESIPIIVLDRAEMKKFENIVENIFVSEKTEELMIEIDLRLYHLYNLNYEEVLIIDPETPITREKYDSYE